MLSQPSAAMPTLTTSGSLASRCVFTQASKVPSAGVYATQETKRGAALHIGNVWPLSLWEVSSG